MHQHDTLHRFLFEDTGIRGELVHIDSSFRAVLERYEYPEPVAGLLGQALAAATLLSATIKFEGSLILQLQGKGAVRLVVAQCDYQRHLRGLARWEGEVEAGTLQEMMEGGQLVITIDPGGGKKRYQGIVSLENVKNLSEALEQYFSQSEQLGTRFWLAGSGDRAAGMLLQHLPEPEQEDELDWERVEILGATVTDHELLELPTEELLYRLYNEEEVRLFEAEPVSFRCGCSRERIEGTLHQLGEEDVRMILSEHGAVKVACEFCNQRYVFDPVDIGKMFAEGFQPEVPQTRQ